MRLIKEEWQEKSWVWHIYCDEQNHWIKEMTLYDMTSIYLSRLMGVLKIELGVIDITSQNIEKLYHIKPHIHIIVDPYSLMRWIETMEERIEDWQEEVAITLESQIKEEKEEISAFLEGFYKASSLKEAYEIYELWQCNRSLCYPLGNKIIDIFQAYEEEIFNYFRYPNISQKPSP